MLKAKGSSINHNNSVGSETAAMNQKQKVDSGVTQRKMLHKKIVFFFSEAELRDGFRPAMIKCKMVYKNM